MICWSGGLRAAVAAAGEHISCSSGTSTSSMVGANASSFVTQCCLAVTTRPCFVTGAAAPSSSSSAEYATALYRSLSTASSFCRSNTSSIGTSTELFLSQWGSSSSFDGSSSSILCRTPIQKWSCFFSGEFSPMVAPSRGGSGGGGRGGGSGGSEVVQKSLLPLGGVRMMGGGPRTYPGGVSKWQWKRMQEKKERQIEKARLLRERESFEERRRQEMLAASPRREKPWEGGGGRLRNPLSPPSAALDPQLRAMADRFRRHDGEDLWTEADGPVSPNGLPSLASARFLPNRSSGASSFTGNGGRPPQFDRSGTGRGSPRFQRDSSAQVEEAKHYSGSSPRITVASPTGNLEGTKSRRTVVNESASTTPGAIQSVKLLQGKLNKSSISRNYASASSGTAFFEDIGEERTERKEMARVPREVETGQRQSAKGGHARPRPGKRSSETAQANYTEKSPQETRQLMQVGQPPSASGTKEAATPSHLSDTRFDDFDVSPISIRALHEVMGYEKMTQVQDATFSHILEGKDVLAKAKTGTGKTIAFLLPAIEAILKSRTSRDPGAMGRSPVNVLVICPTRELASQAATEAKTLMTYHKGLDAQIVIGGTNINSESNNLQKRPCQVLVATPGRLLDHMNSREVRQQLSHLKVLVLDEADRLLDMGFRKDLEKIIQMLPTSRQTLLFSATVPPEVHKVSKVALKPGHVFVDTVGEDTEDTHAKVEQLYVIAPLDDQFGAVYSILDTHINEEKHYKVLVFCTTARCTALLAEWSTKLGLNTLEIHSRKSQAYRTRVSDTFRNSVGGVIMFTSDVSARGVDYPDVTLVIQLGLPAGREEYIHRLGRTGRAGKEGQGVLILAPWEEKFMSALKDIPIAEYPNLKMNKNAQLKVNAALDLVSADTKEKAYQAWLGYYNSAKMLNMSKVELVKLANHFSRTLGLDEPPILMKRTIGMMGLRGVPGLRTE